MGRVVVAAFGTSGSTQSSLGLAIGLRARGHDVTVAGGANLQASVVSYGIPFVGVRPERERVEPGESASSREQKTRIDSMLKRLMSHMDEMYADLCGACEHADALVSHPGAFCAPLVAEKLRLPWLSVALAPGTLYSTTDPPILPSMLWLTRIPSIRGFPHSLPFRAFRRISRKWMEPLDRLRVREGLTPSSKHPMFEGVFSPHGTLALFAQAFASRQPDWPAKTCVTGYPFCAEVHDQPLRPDLEQFLACGEPPVVFTLGSTVVEQAGGFYRESLEAAKRLSCRAVFLTGESEQNRLPGDLPAHIFTCNQASYSRLFPRASAVVHQGGIGTTHHAMSAGVPMLIVPHMLDQPDNAHRASKLGIARVESPQRYTGDSAAQHLKFLLEDPHYRTNAREVQAAMRRENGLATACEEVEKVIRHG